MRQTPFHIYYTAKTLVKYTNSNSLVSAFASSNVEIYPYQIATAQFALRSPYMQGVICGDECSLGKTYESLLVATQKWCEGKNRLLLVLPVNMVSQWIAKIEHSFSLPYILIDTKETFYAIESKNPFLQDCLIITTYEFAVQKAEYIKSQIWDLVIFDEADRLNKVYTGESKTAAILKDAVYGSFKMLLTPTPIAMSIMDIYGLLYFIDETILPMNADEFYKYYFRRPERYNELASWVSKFCFRTLKSQVTGYANFTQRIPYTIGCDFEDREKLLYNKLQEYIAYPKKIVYEQMEQYEMSIQHNHILSSSAQAYFETIHDAIDTLKNMVADESKFNLYLKEIQILTEIKNLAQSVTINGKTKTLLNLLKKCIIYLKKIKAYEKIIIFVDNLTTMKYLFSLLIEQGYQVLTFNGNNSRDYSIMERFRKDKSIQILIATSSVTKGLDIEFCPVVVNYDLLSNALELEQRISRCHRQGQLSDVLVINLFSKNNYADIRYLELINKRTLQFDGIFGLSDTILGNFDADINDILPKMRHTTEIQKAFKQNLAEHELENKEIVKDSINTLFTTFTKEVANKVTVTPQYIEDETACLNDSLWEIVKWYFDKRNEQEEDCYFEINEKNKTITAQNYNELPILFYYSTGNRNKPYKSLVNYGLGACYKGHGKITLASPIGRGIIHTLECSDDGMLIVDSDIESCKIALYCVDIIVNITRFCTGTIVSEQYILVGKTESDKVLLDKDCQKIMSLPVISYTEGERKSASWLKNTTNKYCELDNLVPKDELLQKYIEQSSSAISEEIEQIKCRIERQLKIMQKELRIKEQNFNLDTMRLDIKLEKEINEFMSKEKFTTRVTRHFVLEVKEK